MTRQFLFFFIYLSAVWPIAAVSEASNKLVFSGGGGRYAPALGESVLRQAYANLGYSFELVSYPMLRALKSSNDGVVDGELMRIAGIEKEYPNLIMVPEPLVIVQGVAFTKRKDIKVRGFESLRPYRVAYQRGIKFAEYGTEGMDRVALTSHERAFALLDAGRVDVVVSSLIEGLRVLAEHDYEGVFALEPSLTEQKLYHYLHKRHVELVPSITNSIRRLRAAGELDSRSDALIEQLKLQISRRQEQHK